MGTPTIEHAEAGKTGWVGHFHRAKGWVVAVAGVGAVLSGLVGYYTTYKTVAGKPETSATVTPPAAAAVNPLSVAVLPFSNLTGDPAQSYVADGLTASVTADLARIRDAFIVNVATAAAAVKDKSATAQQVGRELGVRFVLQGSVQRSSDTLRISAQLADTQSNAQLWTETFEGRSNDLFALQDQVTTRIGNSIGREMVIVSARDSQMQKGSTPKVADLMLRAMALRLNPRTPDFFPKVQAAWRDVLALEPNNPSAMSALAASLGLQAQYFSHTLAPAAREPQFQESRRLALAAKLIDPDNALVYVALAMYAEAHDDYPGQLQASETYLALSPKEPLAHNLLGHTLAFGGQYEKARDLLLKGIALDPKHPIDQLAFNLGWVSFMMGDDDACIGYFRRVVENNPTFFDAHGWMAMAYTRKGDAPRAKEAAEALMKVDPKRSFQTRRKPMASAPPDYRKFYDEVYLPVGRKAGVVA
ncbi:tetratricopeptide repeat protein [Caenimonas sp. SL110]|uniref:tetratricopeptide repeat protein n=1 Tax=Caenimonas sp. SL110 TaxID=1450524 RepID=UPI0013793AF1|nr:tetratricopeptide repeat protein [Caenimonas sp. SL110]